MLSGAGLARRGFDRYEPAHRVRSSRQALDPYRDAITIPQPERLAEVELAEELDLVGRISWFSALVRLKRETAVAS